MRSFITGSGWRRTFCAFAQDFFNRLGMWLGHRCYRIADWFGERAQ